MKTYEKPIMEKVESQTESLLVNNTMGDGNQLSKEIFQIDDDLTSEEEL